MFNMPYNTQRAGLIMREYGRNVQYLVDYAVTIKDDEVRNKLVQDIIELMGTMNPTLRNVEDFRHKLWDHLFMISDFKLKAESPYPIPSRETLKRRNIQMRYPRSRIQFAHYGKNVETLIRKAIEMEDPDMRQEFTQVIGNYMKLVYQNWNHEGVSDDIIKTDIKFLSDGALSLDEDINLDSLTRSNNYRRQTGQGGGQQQQGNFRKNYQQNKNRNFKRYNQNNQNNPNYKKKY